MTRVCIAALICLAAPAWALCPAQIPILDQLECSSTIVSQVDHTQASRLGGSCTTADCYNCGGPGGPFQQLSPEAVYSFTCQVSGSVTLLVTDLPCDLDLYILTSACDPYSCVAGSTRPYADADDLTFQCQAGQLYYVVVEAYGTTHSDVASGPCTVDGTNTGAVFSPSYTLSFDVSAGTGCPEDCGDGLDNDLNGFIDCADPACGQERVCCDVDGDDVFATGCGGADCDDTDPDRGPGIPEVLDGVDQDCDGLVDEGTAAYDDDGDGFSEQQGDCDDANPAVRPGAAEVANGVDDDCDGAVDENTEAGDDDGDGFSEQEGDCDDSRASVHPGATELANGIDDDCDGLIDEGTPAGDDDGDGTSEQQGDCDDADAAVHPGATEVANGVDDDCDGIVDEDLNTGDDDGDGWSEAEGDCDDTDASVHPGADDPINGVDDDCDGVVDPTANGDDDDTADDDDAPLRPGDDDDDTVETPELGCGCQTAGGWPGLLLLLWPRRRRA